METEAAANAFSALGQSTRLDLLRALLGAGAGGLAAGDIAARLGVPPSTLSFHLRALEQAGLIQASRHGRSLQYAASIERLRGLLAYLTDAAPGGLDHDQTGVDGMTKPDVFNVLFLCTRNSARSIMAEAVLSRVGGARFRAYSAGSEPAAEGPMPEVLAQLQALGHDVSVLRSKSWELFAAPGAPCMDFVITLCDTVAGQVCPDFGGFTVTAAWPLPDPAKFTGSAAERATMLNELYAGLRRRLEIFTSLPIATLDQMALKARVDELANPHALAR